MRALVRIAPAVAVLIVVAGFFLPWSGDKNAGELLQAPAGALPADEGMFLRTPVKLPEDSQRTLAAYYRRRAYPAAPPAIPHRAFNDQAFGGGACLACHRDGAYSPPLKAYAPVTPHPELASCVSCHVFGSDVPAFRATNFVAAEPPALDQRALPGGPPPIPHTLEMRANCLACHFNAAAPKEIRTTHPERANCRQCHAAIESPPASGTPRFAP